MSDYIKLTCTCGKVLKVPASRAGQTGKCARCGKSVTIPDVSSQESEDIVDSSSKSSKAKRNRFCNQCGKELDRSGRCSNCDKKKEKKPDSKKKHSGLSITQLLLCFLAGLLVGIILGPGYLDILPTQESIMQFFSKFRNSEVTPQEEPQNQQNNEWNQPSNDWNQQNNDWNQPSNDWNQQNNLNSDALKQKEKYLSLVIDATQSAEQYLADLQRETSVLEEQKKKLSNYSLYSENASKLLQESNTLQKKISDSIQFAKQVQSDENWLQLKNAYDRLYPYTGKLTEKDKLVRNIRQEVQSIRSDIEKYDAYQSTSSQTPRVDNTPYIGMWYSQLKQYKEELDELLKKATPTRSAGYVKIQSMMSILKAFQRYPSEVHSAAEILNQTMQNPNKDVYSWITNRKNTAMTQTQKKQAEVLEKFLQNSKQFIIDLFSELQTLNQAVYNVRRDVYNLSDNAIQDLLNILKDINRKYSDEYELFHSAVLNFKQ